MRTVFASRHGSINESIELIECVARGQPLSPAKFSHTVHNAQAGLFSIAARNRARVELARRAGRHVRLRLARGARAPRARAGAPAAARDRRRRRSPRPSPPLVRGAGLLLRGRVAPRADGDGEPLELVDLAAAAATPRRASGPKPPSSSASGSPASARRAPGPPPPHALPAVAQVLSGAGRVILVLSGQRVMEASRAFVATTVVTMASIGALWLAFLPPQGWIRFVRRRALSPSASAVTSRGSRAPARCSCGSCCAPPAAGGGWPRPPPDRRGC